MESLAMSNPIAPVENPTAKPRQVEDAGRMSSGGSQSGVRTESGKRSARQVPPDSVTVIQRGPVTLVRLSRPAKRNALDDVTIAGLETFFSSPPEGTRVVILHGEGKHFSAGADLSVVAETSAATAVRLSRAAHRACDRIEYGDVPVIAAPEGGVSGTGV